MPRGLLEILYIILIILIKYYLLGLFSSASISSSVALVLTF